MTAQLRSNTKVYVAILALILGSMLISTPAVAQGASTADSDSWRATVALYGWFAGTHGSVGTTDHQVGVHQSFGDIFHDLKGVIPIAVDARKGRFVMPVDFIWMKLGDNKGLPLNDLGQTSVDVHLTQSIFTPKVGFRVVDREKFKMDVLGGIRYWHIGQEFSFVPSGVERGGSVNWVDGIGGARFILPVGERAAITLSGDAGAGGAHLDYQGVGLLNLYVTRKISLGAGWRYTDVDYSGNHALVYDAAMSGLLLGMGIDFGGKPEVPPTASCTVSPNSIMAGEPVTGHITTQNFNPKHTVSYNWTGSGVPASSSSESVTVDTKNLAPGSYTLTATATDAKKKKENSATCNGSFTVKEPPRNPPTASCSATPSTVKAGDPVSVAVSANSPDGRPLSYAYQTTAGQITGSGASASLDTTSATPGGTITASSTVSDDRGLTASCNATIAVLAPPVTVQEVSQIGECKFMNPKKPWRVDNECKAVLDDVSLKLQREPNGSIYVVGYEEEEEVMTVQQLGSHRAVNIKKYLVEGEGKAGVDAARVTPVKGKAKGKNAKIYFVPQGATFTAEETETIDETVIKGQPRNEAPPKKKATSAGN